jgi:protein arginine kinase
MAWYQVKGNDTDVVISSRIRLARNVEGYAFGKRLSDNEASALIDRIENALSDGEFLRTDMEQLSDTRRMALVEQHQISHEFATKSGKRALFCNPKTSVSLMACEEDHIRLQCILPGFSLREAYRFATACDDTLDEHLPLAFDRKLGYLTHCPTNLGTGLRASSMLFLPAMTEAGYLPSLSHQLSKLGLTVRGMLGEGTAPRACLYQISNQVTLGLSEEDILQKLEETVKTIIAKERELRSAPTGEAAALREDRIHRAEGILRYATRMTSEEFFRLYTDLKLGVALGIITGISNETLNTLLINVMPATLSEHGGEEAATAPLRDAYRAKFIKQALEVKPK